MKSTFGIVKDAFSGESKVSDVSNMQRTIDLINSLNEQIELIHSTTVESDDNEANERKRSRLALLDVALNKAFEKLNDLSKWGSS